MAGLVPYDQAARVMVKYLSLGNPGKRGPEYIFLVGGAFELDDTALRRVYLQDVEVYYHGGKFDAQNVVFVNCQFVFDNLPNARLLAESILSTSQVSRTLQPTS